MLSAHGSAPELVRRAQERAVVVDAACPLVTKVHHEVKVRARDGYDIVYVGHAGHDEAVGTMAVAPDAVHLVETVDDVAGVTVERPVAFLAQTTLSADVWTDIRDAVTERFADVWLPGRGDLCYATTNRQEALRDVVPTVDAMVIIGSQRSSNTNALERVARESGCARVVRIDTAADLPTDLRGVIGVTAGASVPAGLVDAVVAALAPTGGVERRRTVTETEYFPLPVGLRRRIPAAALEADRSTSASEALERLAGQAVPAAAGAGGAER